MRLDGRGKETIHVILVDEEKKKRHLNNGPKPSTRFGMECYNPEVYAGMHREKDRIGDHVKDAGITAHVILHALQEMTNERVDAFLGQGEEEPAPPPF